MVIYSNNFKIVDDYVIGYTVKTRKEFIFDKDDFDLISKFSWKVDYKNVLFTLVNNKRFSVTKILFNNDNPYIHIDGNSLNNRRSNLSELKGYKNNGKTILNKYIAIYRPEHKRAFDNGCVYEHILVAEKILGRELKEGECVHHKDRNKQNNSEDNLMVFATVADHTSFHNGTPVHLENDVWVTDKKREYIKILNKNNKIQKLEKGIECPICHKNKMGYRASMCKECYNKQQAKNIPPKEELEKLIYDKNNSFCSIGRKYGVTDNAVRKWCKKYGLPYRAKDLKKYIDNIAEM